jgi:hypothetical protein
MRQAARRAVGIGGAGAVAIGAMLALALPASAHTHNHSAGCNTNTDKIEYNLDLEQYQTTFNGKPIKNTVNVTDNTTGDVIVNNDDFGTKLVSTLPVPGDVTVEHKFTIVVVAGDDKDIKNGQGKKGFSFTAYDTASPCPPPSSSSATPPPSDSSVPPSQPPSSQPSSVPPPTSNTTTAPPTTTTTTAVVAAATTTPGSGSLPFTGVNTALPLGIAGLLVVAGGGILFWLRFKARRA